MYNQQLVPNQMYVQPNMMPYAGQPMIAGAMQTNYPGAQQYRGNFPQPVAQPVAAQQWQQQSPPQQTASANQPPRNGANGGHQPQQGPGRGGMGPQQNGQQQNGQQQQHRQRNNEIGEVSRVIHLRNVTPEVTQLGIQNVAANFGDIKHIVMLRQMNQALVEMESAKSAQDLINFFKEPGYAEIDGRRVYVRYSNHPNLTATQHVSRTLLVSMFNTQYDVSAAAQITPEIVFQIFSNYGTVQRIVVLPKNESSTFNHNRVQALVQFDVKEAAEHVKNILQGQPVTLGDTITFTLDIQFSRMEEIKTTNPLTSLEVDAGGQTHRPQGSTHSQEQSPQQSTFQSQSPPQGPQPPPQIISNNAYAMPQQWA